MFARACGGGGATCEQRGRERKRERERDAEHDRASTLSLCSVSPLQASLCFCSRSRPLLIKTNARRRSAYDERSAWISAHEEKTAVCNIDGTRIASRTRHPVPRCLPPTSAGADEEAVASYHRVSLTCAAALSGGRLLLLMVSRFNQQLAAPLCAVLEAQSR